MNEENVRKLEPFYKEIWKNSKRFTNTNEDVPSYIDVDIVFDIVDKYDAINGKKLEKSEKARKEAIELIKSKEYVIDLYTFGYELDDYDIFKVKRILDIDKGE